VLLLCGAQSSRRHHLAFADHMHELNAGQGRSSPPERLTVNPNIGRT
jgi:hypothetical protein